MDTEVLVHNGDIVLSHGQNTSQSYSYTHTPMHTHTHAHTQYIVRTNEHPYMYTLHGHAENTILALPALSSESMRETREARGSVSPAPHPAKALGPWDEH